MKICYIFVGYSSLVFDSTCSRLFASCTDDIIYMYDFASYNTTPGITKMYQTELQIRGGIQADSKIIFLISKQKYNVVTPH